MFHLSPEDEVTVTLRGSLKSSWSWSDEKQGMYHFETPHEALDHYLAVRYGIEPPWGVVHHWKREEE